MRISNPNRALALAAALLSIPTVAACSAGGAMLPSTAARQAPASLAASSTALTSAAGCAANCATPIAPLRATIANGTIAFTLAGALHCKGEPFGSAPPVTISANQSGTINSQTLSFGCAVSTSTANHYYIVAVPAALTRMTVLASTPINGSGVIGSNGGAQTLTFYNNAVTLPAGREAFYLAYCATCSLK